MKLDLMHIVLGLVCVHSLLVLLGSIIIINTLLFSILETSPFHVNEKNKVNQSIYLSMCVCVCVCVMCFY